MQKCSATLQGRAPHRTRLKPRTTFITPLTPLTLRGELCVSGRHEANPPAKPWRAGASHYIYY
jgi:hypothetical protein